MNQLVGMEDNPSRRSRLLHAGRELMLTKGFSATTIDQVCRKAGVTKGSFFHYFATKDDLARALVEGFAEELFSSFRNAPFREVEDPVERALGYIDWTKAVTKQSVLERGCLLGMFSLELADVRPDVREYCATAFTGWAADLEQILERAAATRMPPATIDAAALSRQLIITVEGALILSKAHHDRRVVDDALDQFRSWVMGLLGGKRPKEAG